MTTCAKSASTSPFQMTKAEQVEDALAGVIHYRMRRVGDVTFRVFETACGLVWTKPPGQEDWLVGKDQSYACPQCKSARALIR